MIFAHRLLARGLFGAFFLVCGGEIVFAQGRPVCQPKVDTNTRQCDFNGHVQTWANVTNNCDCDVDVTVHLPGGGAATFSGIKKNGGSGSQMIMACGDKTVNSVSFDSQFHCPINNSTANEPGRQNNPPSGGSSNNASTDKSSNEFSSRLDAATKKAANADATFQAQRQQVMQQENKTISQRDKELAAARQDVQQLQQSVQQHTADEQRKALADPANQPMIFFPRLPEAVMASWNWVRDTLQREPMECEQDTDAVVCTFKPSTPLGTWTSYTYENWASIVQGHCYDISEYKVHRHSDPTVQDALINRVCFQ